MSEQRARLISWPVKLEPVRRVRHSLVMGVGEMDLDSSDDEEPQSGEGAPSSEEEIASGISSVA